MSTTTFVWAVEALLRQLLLDIGTGGEVSMLMTAPSLFGIAPASAVSRPQ